MLVTPICQQGYLSFLNFKFLGLSLPNCFHIKVKGASSGLITTIGLIRVEFFIHHVIWHGHHGDSARTDRTSYCLAPGTISFFPPFSLFSLPPSLHFFLSFFISSFPPSPVSYPSGSSVSPLPPSSQKTQVARPFTSATEKTHQCLSKPPGSPEQQKNHKVTF